jgi:hypothetical protein
MVLTRLGVDDDGRPVLRKEAPGGDEPALERLRREAAVLRAARHPGVVEVAEHTEGPEGAVLVLRWAGSRTVADLRPPVEVAARVAAALAATVADLHGLGVRHGAIRPEHVVLAGDARPVLCGFGAAAAGPAGPGGPTEADDVAGVGTVVRALVGADTDLEPIPERRFSRRRSWSGMTRRALLTLADQATADDPARRPSARALAASLAGVARDPAAEGDGRHRANRLGPPVPRHAAGERSGVRDPLPAGAGWMPGRAALGALGAAGAAAVVAGAVLVVTGSGRAGGVDGFGVAPPSTDAVPTTTVSTTTVTEPPPACEPAEDGLLVDHDGDGCPSPATVHDRVVEVAGRRYGVGRDGDALVLGDWDCDGAATVAVLRPATGEVFVFDRWAGPAADVVARPRTRVDGGVAVEGVDDDGDGCPTLVVVTAAGGRTVVPA